MSDEKENKSSGEVDIYFQPVEETDDDDLRNLAENPRALTEDFSEESVGDLSEVTAGQDQFDTHNASEYDEGGGTGADLYPCDQKAVSFDFVT